MAQLININSTEFRRCNLSAIQSGGTWASIVPDANEIILISTTNALTADGSGDCDAYIIGDGSSFANVLELKEIDSGLKEIIAEVNGSETDVFGSLVFEQGGISTANGSNQSSQTQIRSGFINASSLRVIVTNGSVYVYGWNGETYLSAVGWKTGTNDFQIPNATRYKVVFKRSNGQSISPSGADTLGAHVLITTRENVVKYTEQSLPDESKEVARNNIGAMSAAKEEELKAYTDDVVRNYTYEIEGKGSTIISGRTVLIPGRKYTLCFKGDWAYSGTDTKFQIKWNTGTSVYNYNGGSAVPSQLYLAIPASVKYLTYYVRANVGVKVNFCFVDITNYIEKIITGVLPYANFTRTNNGWTAAISSNTKFYTNNTNNALSPASGTFTFSATNSLLVFNIASLSLTQKTSVDRDEVLLLDYRAASQDFVGGLLFPYFKSIRWNTMPFVDVAGFNITETNEVTWDSLTLYHSDGTRDTFGAMSFVLTSSASILAINDGEVVIGDMNYLLQRPRSYVLLQLRNGVLSDGLLLPFVQNKKNTSWYNNEYELNIKRLGDQMKNVKWTPKADVRSNEGLNVAGVEVTGVPYSSVKEELKFVGVDVSLHTFMTAVNDIHSLLYTENVSAANSRSAYGKTYHGVNSICYYGSVCSGFVTTAIGGIVQFNSWEYQTYPERFHIIEEQDEQNLMIGDIISEPGHCAIITRLYRTLSGKITDIEVSEHGAPLRTTTYRLLSLIDRRRQTGIVYCRMNNQSLINKFVTYTPSPFVLADGESLYTGGDFVYIDGNTRTYYQCTQQNSDATFVSAKWRAIPVFSTGTQISVNNYRQYGEGLYRCKVTHTPESFEPDKWEYVKGVKEWSSYPYTYNNDIVTFAGDRAAFRLGDDIYINYAKGSYTKMQVYKDGTLLDELTLGDDYQVNVTSLIASSGLYKARLSDGANYSRYTYFEVIDTNVTASMDNEVATVNYSSNYGTPIDVQIVELSGFTICHFAVDGGSSIKIDPKAGLYRQRHHYYGRYNNYNETIYARVVFAGEYGNVASEMISLGTLTPITGILVHPNETTDLGELTGVNNIILSEGLSGQRYEFSFVAGAGSSISLRSVLGSLRWATAEPTLQEGGTYIFSIINGIVHYDVVSE